MNTNLKNTILIIGGSVVLGFFLWLVLTILGVLK